jgi:uncharacterized protein (DUF2141 family)
MVASAGPSTASRASFERAPTARSRAFHDENGNAKLDESFPGVPTGPYGFSNDAQGLLGPPTFDAAAVTVGEGDEAVRIALIYRGESG